MKLCCFFTINKIEENNWDHRQVRLDKKNGNRFNLHLDACIYLRFYSISAKGAAFMVSRGHQTVAN